jgi:hypothetical protein
MRRAAVLLTAAVAAVLALPVSATAAPVLPEAPPAAPVLTSVSLSSGKVSVKGLDTVPVTVTVTATGYDEGSCPGHVAGGVALFRTSAQTWDRSATGGLVGPMFCVSANGDERTYWAVIAVPSTADGPWRVTSVVFANYSYTLDPRTFGLPDATLAVTGTHRPRLRVSVRPQPLPYPARDINVTVQATYDDTGAPVTTRWIGITDDGGQVGGCGLCAGNTDSNGRVTRRFTLTGLPLMIAWMPLSASGYEDTPAYSALGVPVVVQPALTATPATDSVRHGASVDVNGRAFAAVVQNWPFKPRITVGLQRLVGKHWRTVSEGTIRPGGRFTLLATPPKGHNLYRVGLQQQHFAPAHSRTFAIRGT